MTMMFCEWKTSWSTPNATATAMMAATAHHGVAGRGRAARRGGGQRRRGLSQARDQRSPRDQDRRQRDGQDQLQDGRERAEQQQRQPHDQPRGGQQGGQHGDPAEQDPGPVAPAGPGRRGRCPAPRSLRWWSGHRHSSRGLLKAGPACRAGLGGRILPRHGGPPVVLCRAAQHKVPVAPEDDRVALLLVQRTLAICAARLGKVNWRCATLATTYWGSSGGCFPSPSHSST